MFKIPYWPKSHVYCGKGQTLLGDRMHNSGLLAFERRDPDGCWKLIRRPVHILINPNPGLKEGSLC